MQVRFRAVASTLDRDKRLA